MLKEILQTFLISITLSIHIHFIRLDYSATNYPQLVADNLPKSNLNYYFGNMAPDRYYQWVSANIKISSPICPAVTPFATYSQNSFLKCIDCEDSTNIMNESAKLLFNLQTRQCEVCTPNKTAFCDQVISSRLDYLKNLSNINSTSSNSQTFNSTNTTNTPFALCPPQKPLYNSTTKLCNNCPDLQQFDGPSQKCIPIIFITNTKAINILAPLQNYLQLQLYKAQQNNPTRLIQECSAQKPYLQKDTCISCPNHWLYNITSQNCIQRCPQGNFYNEAVLKCEKGVYFTDVNAKNIVSQAQSYQKWKEKVTQLSKSSIKMIKCKPQAPYEVNGKCIECGGDKPLFSIDQQKCISCDQGRYYNSQRHHCLGSYSSAGSLRRVIANIS